METITCVWILEQIPGGSLGSLEWLSWNRWSSGEMCCLTWPCQGLRPWTGRKLAKLPYPPNPHNKHGEVLGLCFWPLPQRAHGLPGPVFLYLCRSFSSFPHCLKSCLRDLEGQDKLRSRAGIFPTSGTMWVSKHVTAQLCEAKTNGNILIVLFILNIV